MPSTTASNPHVEALWWLVTSGGSKTIQQPGEKRHRPRSTSESRLPATDYEIILADPIASMTRTLRAKTRDELLDKLVALMVSEKLS